MSSLDEKKGVEIIKEMGDKITEFKEKHEARYEAIEKELTAMKRPGNPGFKGGNSTLKQKQSMELFARKGEIDLDTKSLQIGNDDDGGYAVPEIVESEVERLEQDASAIFRLANVVDAKSSKWQKLVSLGGAASGWVGETDARNTTTAPKLAKVVIELGELYANPQATQTALDDISFDAASWLIEEVSETFSDQAAASFINGDGTNKPKGILTYPTALTKDATRAFGTLQHVVSSAAGIITFNDLKKVKSALRAKYRRGAAWVMNETTAMLMSSIKDDTGAYMWNERVSDADSDTLMGYPVEIDENMPDVAAGADAILFGNFKRGYAIPRRMDIRMLRDPFTAKPYVNFYTTQRIGGGVVNSEAIKILKLAS